MKAPLPSDEARRLEAVRECRILDTDSEEDFDELTRLASRICEAPISLMSLVDEDRQWFKSRVGLEVHETARDIAFCAHAILQSGLMVVPDALADERFRDNPLVTSDPNIRFYAGAPLVLRDGFAAGTLCVLDRVPRKLTADQEEALRILSHQIGVRLDLRRAQVEVERSHGLLRAANAEIRAVLAASKSRFGALLDHANDAIWFVSEDGRILEANRAAEEMYGRPRESFVGLDISSLRPEAARETARAQFGEAFARERLLFETEHVRTDGTAFPVEVSTRLFDMGGEKVLLSVVRDITARRRAEAALRDSEARFRAIIEASPVPCALNDAGENITYLNAAFINTFGYDLEDIPTLAEWWPKAYPDPEYRRWVAATWRMRLDGAKAAGVAFQPLEISIRCKDGSLRTAVGSAAALSETLEGVHLVVLYDITERKRAEEQLRALTARLQSVREEEATRIAREIHDEPGQNLTALKMDLAWLKKELTGRGVSTKRASLVKHVDEMTGLVDDTVETIQRISEDLRPAALDKLGLAEAAEAKVDEFRRRAGISSRLSCLLDGVAIDPGLATAAYRILQELLTNVARHAKATEVDVRLEEARGDLVLVVSDNGRGITEAEMASPKSLGLAGIRERVLLTGGTISLEGATGRGTKATVRLPLRPREPT